MAPESGSYRGEEREDMNSELWDNPREGYKRGEQQNSERFSNQREMDGKLLND